MPNLSIYRKTIAAVVIGLIGWSTAVITSEATNITASEWIGLATAIATALGVYSVVNETSDGGQ